MNDKKAEPWSPLQIALMGLLSGAGVYGGHRLLRDTYDQAGQSSGSEDELEIAIPRSKLHPELEQDKVRQMMASADGVTPQSGILSQAEEEAFDKLGGVEGGLELAGKGLLGAGTFLAGYGGTSALYEKRKKMDLEEEKKKVQKEYLDKLQHIARREKLSSCTDWFCEGVRSGFVDVALVKSAVPINDPEGIRAATDYIRGAFSRPDVSPWPAVLEGVKNVASKVTDVVGPPARDLYDTATNNPISNAVVGGLALATLLSGAGIYGLGKYTTNKQKDEEDQPTRLKLRLV
jgi:hypothetical protein